MTAFLPCLHGGVRGDLAHRFADGKSFVFFRFHKTLVTQRQFLTGANLHKVVKEEKSEESEHAVKRRHGR